MASNDLMVGLEIGTSKICVVVGETRLDGTIENFGRRAGAFARCAQRRNRRFRDGDEMRAWKR